uniref:Uncharacterized protein n=2 Tax=Avena sativa TaxID=4498 RepID=A0ACD5VF54_AVESA
MWENSNTAYHFLIRDIVILALADVFLMCMCAGSLQHLIRPCLQYMVFACADSRVCPTLTLGLHPGEAFTVRNVAGMVPAYQETRHCSIGSAIEFAVVVLKVEYIVVIGHSCCGGIRELLSLNDEGPNAYHFIEDWVKIGLDAKKKVQRENRLLPFDDQCTVLEKEAVNVSLRNLKSYPFVKDRTWKGTLHLIGARYDFVQGSFETWEP